MNNQILQYVLYIAILIALAIPLGRYIGKVMNREKTFLSKALVPVENFTYKVLHVDKNEDMGWKKYAVCCVLFSALGFAILFFLNMAQGFLPLNPQGFEGTSAHLAFNTTASFVSNTNWQSYSGESTLSYLTQMLGLTVQNFVSAATGMVVLFALIRGFTREKGDCVGNFWVDMTRATWYVLIPLSIVVALLLVSQGVVQNLSAYTETNLLQPQILADGTTVTGQIIPQGPAASQIAIKQLGTNGGGFFGVNSAFPLENPTIFSNMIEMISLLLIPVALCFTFGRNVKDKRQGLAIFLAMIIMLVAFLAVIGVNEASGTPQLTQDGAVNISATDGQAGGNMEGKESRFGIATSSTWASFTTAASNGSVNSMHDSYTQGKRGRCTYRGRR